MAWCLVKDKSQEFLRRLKTGALNVDELAAMTSTQRREAFSFLGEDEARRVNALFESKLLLKYQKKGMLNWIKQVSGLKQEAKRDLLSRVQRMEEVLSPEDEAMFLEDLAARKLGIGVTQEEAENIYKLSKTVDDLSDKYDPKSQSWSSEDARLQYGIALNNFKNYTKDLKIKAEAKGWGDYIKNPLNIIIEAAAASKSFLATLDNSFFGRQGIKTLFTKPQIWTKGFVKSWGDIGRVLKGKGFKKLEDGSAAIKADVWSRPNAMNGRYQKMKLDVGLESEEAFPSSIPERIPILGRLFQASETAFNGGAMRMRADLADRYLQIAKRHGIDIDNADELRGIGTLINSQTGRGRLGKAESISRELNVLFFSVKFLKANFDTLTAHMFDSAATPFAKKQAAQNLLSIIVGMGSVLGIANAIDDDAVDLDPRSSDFGKIKIGNTRIDITGGMGTLVTLASRVFVPTKHNGEWGLWYKSSTSGKFTKLTDTSFGQRDAWNVFLDTLISNKLSPAAGILRDVWRGENWDREEVTIRNAAKNLTTPISIQNLEELLNSGEEGEKIVVFMILDALGFGTTTYE